MMELMGKPDEIPDWIAAIDGEPVDWRAMLANYRTLCDWPGASFWPELSATFPDALVLLSVREPESWYRSASDTIFFGFQRPMDEPNPWMDAMARLLHDRFSDQFDDPTAMMDAMARHNDAVRAAIPANRLLEWQVADGWEPICERLGVAVPDEPFPVTNTTNEFRDMVGLPPVE